MAAGTQDGQFTRIAARVAALLTTGLVGGCAAAPPDFNSPEPAARNAAIVRAAREGEQAAIPDLVRLLDSDDPATRVLSIRTLERLTGQTLGYDPAGDAASRDRAIAEWTAWCDREGSQVESGVVRAKAGP
jgi:HEAT repeat protein